MSGYLCCFTDANNEISFEVVQELDLYTRLQLEFAKYVSQPYEKLAVLNLLSKQSLSDVYLIFSLMEGENWHAVEIPNNPMLQRHNADIF